jgi:hypothetical protein
MLEYLPCSPLNEVFVHGRNPPFYWNRIFGLMKNFLKDARQCTSETDQPSFDSDIRADSMRLYADKTYARLITFAEANDIDLDRPQRYGGFALPSLRAIASDCIARTEILPIIPAVLHGDLCLSNILFDSRAGSIKVIDPRGISQSGEVTLWGDQKYDLAKLSHSVVGLYDYIIAGRYRIESKAGDGDEIVFDLDGRLHIVQQIFLKTELIPGLSSGNITPLTVLLFLSMLPLHADRPDRQNAMLVNALRLYSSFTHKNF